MCILEIFTDVYPNNVEHRHQRLLTCDESHNHRACDRIFAHEHSPRLLPYGEAPPALMASQEDGVTTRAVRPPSLMSSSTSISSKSAGRKYWKKGERILVDIDLPSFGRKSKKEREEHDNEIVKIVEGRPSTRDRAIPIPPPAPMAPTSAAWPPTARHTRTRSRRHSVYAPDEEIVVVPPPPYRDRRERRRSPTGAPLIIQVAPPESSSSRVAPPESSSSRVPPPPPAAVPIPETILHAQPHWYRGEETSAEQPQATGDQILRRHVERERERRAQRQAERRQAAEDRQREDEEQRDRERRRTEEAQRRANIRTEQSTQAVERERIAARNAEHERAQQARERDAQARREERRARAEFARDRAAATGEALLRGQRVARSLRTPVTVRDERDRDETGHESAGGESWASAPGDVRIIQHHRRGGQGMREHGERVLDAAGRRWTEEEERRLREEERRLGEEDRRLRETGEADAEHTWGGVDGDADPTRRRHRRHRHRRERREGDNDAGDETGGRRSERVVWGDERRF